MGPKFLKAEMTFFLRVSTQLKLGIRAIKKKKNKENEKEGRKIKGCLQVNIDKEGSDSKTTKEFANSTCNIPLGNAGGQ